MKKGDYIKISDDAWYPGQDMRWTEECTGVEKLPTGTKLYHYSDTKIKEFLSKETCFFYADSTYGHCTVKGHCYEVILKKPVTVREYLSEVRFWIFDTNCDIRYLGKVEVIYTGKKIENGVDSWTGKMTYKKEIIIKDNRVK